MPAGPDLFPDGPLWDGHVVRAVMRADERIALVSELVKLRIVGPHVLREFELPDQAGAADKRGNASLDTVFGSAFRQRRTVGPAAPDDACRRFMFTAVSRGFMRRMWAPSGQRIAVRVHLCVIEIVVALRVARRAPGRPSSGASTSGAPLRHRPISFAAISSCSSGVSPLAAQEIAERADMLFHPPIGEIAAVARKDLRLRQCGGGARLRPDSREKIRLA